jgi:hypothetical protein
MVTVRDLSGAPAFVTRILITVPTGRRRRLNDAAKSIRERPCGNERVIARRKGQRFPRGGLHVMTTLAPAGRPRTRRRVTTRRWLTATAIDVAG